MSEFQRAGLTEDVARILGGPGPHADLLELRRIIWGFTRAELVEILDNLDHMVAREYVAYDSFVA